MKAQKLSYILFAVIVFLGMSVPGLFAAPDRDVAEFKIEIAVDRKTNEVRMECMEAALGKPCQSLVVPRKIVFPASINLERPPNDI